MCFAITRISIDRQSAEKNETKNTVAEPKILNLENLVSAQGYSLGVCVWGGVYGINTWCQNHIIDNV